MRHRLAVALGAFLLVALSLEGTAALQKPVDLAVTVAYTGQGTVDATHEILVFLFTSPNISEASEPIAVEAVTKSGGTATFKGVTQDPVYVVMVYDEKANYDGKSGPPPAGAPIGNYAKGGKLIPVKPSETPKVKATFDDSVRWGQQK
jgi:hypothetical protein